MKRQTHYSLATEPEKMLLWVQQAVPIAVKISNGKKPLLCFCGFSGAAHGIALSLGLAQRRIDHGTIYVRKSKEVHHHHDQPVEFNLDQNVVYCKSFDWRFNARLASVYCPIFIDDLVSSGDTKNHVRRVIYNLGSDQLKRRLGFMPPEGDYRWRSDAFLLPYITARNWRYKDHTDPEYQHGQFVYPGDDDE